MKGHLHGQHPLQPSISRFSGRRGSGRKCAVRSGFRSSPMRDVEQFPFSRGPRQREAQHREMIVRTFHDRERLAAVAAGDPDRTAEFIAAISSVVWNACRVLSGEEAETRAAFLEVMAALSAN